MSSHLLLNKQILLFDEVESTQDLIKEYVGHPSIKVVGAKFQTKGRGRNLNAKWEAPSKSSFMGSFIVELQNTDYNQNFPGNLTVLGSLALHNLLLSYGVPTIIKYPNDILVEDKNDPKNPLKKVAGILGELIDSDTKKLYYSLGVGINLFQTPDQFPQRPIYPASSLKALGYELGHLNKTSFEELFETLANDFYYHLNALLKRL